METYGQFAEILDYPTSLPLTPLDGLLQSLRGRNSVAISLLAKFREFVEHCTLERLEELYTATFDLQPLCYPYVGYQLFGEEFRRGLFMARLKEQYRLALFDSGKELPDHICVILRFLAGRETGEFEQVLVADGLVPALGKIVSGAAEKKKEHAYLLPVQALSILLVSGM
jgi:nitrate reductase molybdenum cofactor assembly chaperone NarJ/NarW